MRKSRYEVKRRAQVSGRPLNVETKISLNKKEEYVTHTMKVTTDLTTLQLNQLFERCLEHLPGQWEMDVFVREGWAGLSGMQVLEHCLVWATATFDFGKLNHSRGYSGFTIKMKCLLCYDFCSEVEASYINLLVFLVPFGLISFHMKQHFWH